MERKKSVSLITGRNQHEAYGFKRSNLPFTNKFYSHWFVFWFLKLSQDWILPVLMEIKDEVL
jgi:hypothetical protein